MEIIKCSLLQKTLLAGTTVSVDLVDIGGAAVPADMKRFVVSIYFNDAFYDYRCFDTQVEAEGFMADPMRADREKAEKLAAREAAREAANDAHAANVASLAGCNRGRKISRKPGC